MNLHKQNKPPPSIVSCRSSRTPIRHYFPMCRGNRLKPTNKVCIGISPLPGSPRAAPIACDAFIPKGYLRSGCGGTEVSLSAAWVMAIALIARHAANVFEQLDV